MTTIQGTITATAAPGPALMAVMHTTLTALGWTLEDTVVIAANTHSIYKSAAAGNARSLDFFLDFNYPTTGVTGGFRIAPFEGYTAATDVGLRGPFGHVTVTTLDATTYSRYGAATSALETNWLNTATSTLSVTLSVSNFNYWVSITRNRVIVLLTTQIAAIYAGFFIPNAAHIANAGASLFPLIMTAVTVNGTSNSTNSIATALAAVTRVPKASAISWNTSVSVLGTAAQIAAFASGTAGVALSEFTGDIKVVPYQVVFGVGGAPAVSSTVPMGAVGELDGVAGGWLSATAARGDTILDGAGDSWVVAAPSFNWGMFLEMV